MANIYIISQYPTFIKPIAKELQDEGHTVVITKEFYPFCAKDADIIYCDWMDQNALKIQELKSGKRKTVLKCHSYEAFTGIQKHINFRRWDGIIFVNEYIKSVVYPHPLKQAHIIPNGIKVDDLQYTEAENKNIGFLGYWSRKKGIELIDFLAKSFPDYNFHLGGKFQEPDVQDYIKKKKSSNLYLHGWISNKSKFFSEMKYVINASIRESQCVGLMEGMVTGCKPLIKDWIGADKMYKSEWLYDDLASFKKLLEGEYEPQEYRKFIKANYDFDKWYKEFKEVLL
ncbi:MAG: hypothetical protein KGY74_07655 [Candidatus Cloacimonetes bacterium]|nr:hypothetical protein [Candidatus Cloacimonadota bacterium]